MSRKTVKVMAFATASLLMLAARCGQNTNPNHPNSSNQPTTAPSDTGNQATPSPDNTQQNQAMPDSGAQPTTPSGGAAQP